jgi:hypothetical protein
MGMFVGGLALAAGAACDQGATQPPGPTTTTEFHVSMFNACQVDMRIRLDDPSDESGTIWLYKSMRETIKGTTETLWLIDDHGEAVASYQPRQGKQKVRITADCTGMIREP